jgi:hypothetical protein
MDYRFDLDRWMDYKFIMDGWLYSGRIFRIMIIVIRMLKDCHESRSYVLLNSFEDLKGVLVMFKARALF